jgi:hypothetical protein
MMEGQTNRVSCEEVNSWDIIEFLKKLGFEPKKIRGEDYWYLSPFREERTASFKVFRKGNVWFDHGIGQGGSLVDFCMQYYGCNLKEVLQKLSDHTAYLFKRSGPYLPRPERVKEITILSIQALQSPYLKRYFESRFIPLYLAQQFCKEVNFSMHEKTYTAIGFQNQSGGYELRNAWFKGSSSPKDITLLSKGNNTLAVFEGFFDFLSYQTLQPESISQKDFLILNSLSFITRAIPIMQQYGATDLYLDKGLSARLQTKKVIEQVPGTADKSNLYKGFDDLNEYHCGLQKINTTKRLKGPKIK